MRKQASIALIVLATLAACRHEGSPPPLAPLQSLHTFRVTAPGDLAGRAWDGVIEPVHRADITAQTAGRITAVPVDVDSQVHAGDVLVRLTAVEQQAGADTARAQLRAAEAAASEAALNYRRYAALADGKFVSRAQIDQAKAARDTAVAARDAARAQVSQAAQQAQYTMVRAPFTGIISRRDVQPGESVAPGAPLLSVYSPGEMRIEVAVPQSEADAIRASGRTARIVLGDGRMLDAADVTVFPAADVATHSVNVRVRLPDVSPRAAPGTTAKVVFAIANAPDQAIPVSIPVAAVTQRGELSAVYVRDGDRLLLRQLRLGAQRGDSIEIISGLKAGEIVASDPVAAAEALAAQRKASPNE